MATTVRSCSTVISFTINPTIRATHTFDDGEEQVSSSQLGGQLLTGTLATGIEESQGNRAWHLRGREITSGNTLDIDLYDMAGEDVGGGAGNDAIGQAMAVEEILLIAIMQTGGTGRLEIMPSSPAGALAWMPDLTVANGGALRYDSVNSRCGMLFMMNPGADSFDISDGSSHVLRLKANGGAVTVDILLVGKHDDNESSSSTTSTASSSTSCSTASSTSTGSSSSSTCSSLSTSTTSTLSPSSGSTTSTTS